MHYIREIEELTEQAEEIWEEETEAETEEDTEDGFAPLLEAGMDERIFRAVKELGFRQPSPIQLEAIPHLLQGRDLLGQAQTGTGKTAAFGIPMLQNVDAESRELQGIVLCPTRELAIQAAQELRKLARYMQGIRILPVYGGQDITQQIRGLRGVQIVVGTPGRVMDHLRRHTMRTEAIRMVVLDEADEMLNMGFREDMETILGQIPEAHQTALFSATMPQPILDITSRFQAADAVHIRVAARELTIPLVDQVCYRVGHAYKEAACARILEYYQPRLALIFCNTKRRVDELAEWLKKKGYQAEALHGDLSQGQRDVVMSRFRNGAASILIATDVAARGIDVDDVEVVINYDIPQDTEYYVHRIGRTGRAGRTGKAFTLLTGREGYRIREIERACNTHIAQQKLPGAQQVTQIRAERIMQEILHLREERSLQQAQEWVDDVLNRQESAISARELAAAFLQYCLGEDAEEIPQERSGRPEGRSRYGRSYAGRERDDRGHGRRDDRGHGRRDDRSYGRRDDRSYGRRDDRSYGRRDDRSCGRRDERRPRPGAGGREQGAYGMAARERNAGRGHRMHRSG